MSKKRVWNIVVFEDNIRDFVREKKTKMGTFSEIELIIGIFGTISASICAFGTF